MPKTRATHKRSASARKSYRRRVRSSPCRKKGPAVCRSLSSCKYVSGKKRSFCRKGTNTRRSKHAGSKHKRAGSKHKHAGGSRKKRGQGGRGVLSGASVPFGLWGLKSLYSRK